MENKTIRVWNKMVDSCSTCPLFHWDDCGGGVCSEIDLNIDTREPYEIDKDCPFSKPLSKEQIESCGFIEFKSPFGVNYPMFKKNNWVLCWRNIEFNNFQIELTHPNLFTENLDIKYDGTINNLPEFKLILKMLNIE